MRLFAAIDILDQKAVRLSQGDFARKIVYDENPASAAMRLWEMGAESLHIVDLNAAKEGIGSNLKIIEEICKKTRLFVQAGGGVRTAEAADRLFSIGADRIVIGTKAVLDPSFAEELSFRHPGQVAVGLDSMNGYAMANGWLESSGVRIEDMIVAFEGMPLASIVLTDISKDGMLEGTDASFYERLLPLTRHEVTASGGITTVSDLVRLKSSGVKSAIVGKALYEGTIDIKAAAKALE